MAKVFGYKCNWTQTLVCLTLTIALILISVVNREDFMIYYPKMVQVEDKSDQRQQIDAILEAISEQKVMVNVENTAFADLFDAEYEVANIEPKDTEEIVLYNTEQEMMIVIDIVGVSNDEGDRDGYFQRGTNMAYACQIDDYRQYRAADGSITVTLHTSECVQSDVVYETE